jgi:hypothetical protein
VAAEPRLVEFHTDGLSLDDVQRRYSSDFHATPDEVTGVVFNLVVGV